MIQDATGKFSSRWVLPDRNSLARFIRTWLLSLYQAWSVSSAAAQSLRVFAQAAQAYTPYRGIRPQNQSVCDVCTAASRSADIRSACGDGLKRQRRRLLPVVFQHLRATLGQLRAIFLQARQHGKVALIKHGAAVLLRVTGTGFLLLGRPALRRLLSERSIRKRE